ncbi:IRF tryptophan pentad repeat domain-containing protein [Trichonephila inaurata madagascariensis]|uniref:IRF tryptophan pentad repeat domain-containing protein n=1 Tax=Trichonephila inaurata madagascariensis TaxID=2747483 RepID=A0A8X7CL67_9ARAC|nr:IRF tryptophan pentad repeat domain-containing protein [Trichonephila inaurata madagascariensis]
MWLLGLHKPLLKDIVGDYFEGEKNMSRAGRRLVEDFLVPALNSEKYGDLLKWLNKEEKIFSIKWSHKNASNWQHHDTIVFQDWDKLKGHFRPERKGYYMQAKQRFRAALYKLDTVKRLEPLDKSQNVYQLIDSKKDEKKKRGYESTNRPKRTSKKENQRSIPTSVIKKNTSYIAKSNEYSKVTTHTVPSSVSTSRGNKSRQDQREKEMKKCYDEYMSVQRKQRLLNTTRIGTPNHEREEMSPISKVHDLPVLQNNSVTRETPIVKQIIPVYYQKQPDSQKRFESPLVFVASTFIDCVPKSEEVDGVMKYWQDCEVKYNSNYALNLSRKSDDSDSLSR